MKKLISLFTTTKPQNLKTFLNIDIKDELISFDMPNVGEYKEGSRTKIKN